MESISSCMWANKSISIEHVDENLTFLNYKLMKIFAMIGSVIVCFALIFYTFGFCKLQRKRIVNSQILTFFILGVLGDISATILMILGSTKGMLTFHGFLGFSALLAMLIDTYLLWRYKLKKGPDFKVNEAVNIYSRFAFFLWIVAFITGMLMVIIRHV
jgi:hypothetical protein